MTHSARLKKHHHWTLKQFNWRALIVRVLVNALTLMITVVLTPSMGFVNPTIWTILLLGIVLGVLNAIVKPIIQFFTLSLIFVTYGVVVIFINTIILYILSWLMPHYFYVDNFFWALLGGVILGTVAGFLESLFGLTLPIVDEESINEPMRKAMEFDEKKQRSFPYKQLEEHTGVTPPPTPTLPDDTTTEAVPTVGASQQPEPVAATPEPAQQPAPEAAMPEPEQKPAPAASPAPDEGEVVDSSGEEDASPPEQKMEESPGDSSPDTDQQSENVADEADGEPPSKEQGMPESEDDLEQGGVA